MSGFWIVVLIFLVMGGLVAAPVIAQAAMQLEDEKEREARYRELTTISKDEADTIRQIMKQYKWKTMYSPTYLVDSSAGYIKVDTEKIATSLAMKYAKTFAVLNGFDVDLLFKLYYMYNKANGELCIGDTTYSTGTVPAKRDVLTGRITEGYTYEYNHETRYHVKFFILESVA